MKNLTTIKGRLEAFKKLNEECKTVFINHALVKDNALIIVHSERIEISIRGKANKPLFGSEVTLYRSYKRFGKHHENEISFGSTGVFSPNNHASFYRTIYAANCLKDWKNVCSIVNKYCRMYSDLENEIFVTNVEGYTNKKNKN